MGENVLGVEVSKISAKDIVNKIVIISNVLLILLEINFKLNCNPL